MSVENKTERVMVRLTPTQADDLRAKAEREGERVSTWLRQVGLRAARSSVELQEQG
jgi:uncharacterized protein (DUF1778 family)